MTALLLLGSCSIGGGMVRLSPKVLSALRQYQSFSVQSSQTQGAEIAAYPNLPQRGRNALERVLTDAGLASQEDSPQLVASLAIGVVHEPRDTLDRYGIELRTGISSVRGMAADQGRLRFSLRIKDVSRDEEIAFTSVERPGRLDQLDDPALRSAMRHLVGNLNW